jgi:hypothetical protein
MSAPSDERDRSRVVIAWALGFFGLALPWLLFSWGELLHFPTWRDVRALIGALWLVPFLWACLRAKTIWPVLLVLLLPLSWVFGWGWHLHRRFPCWSYSNAEWCGRFCQADPCRCPERDPERDSYGSGEGCPEP